MADSSFNRQHVKIDLTVVGAREIRKASDGAIQEIRSIKLQGTTGPGVGHIVLRHSSASGPEVWRQDTDVNTFYETEGPPTPKGTFPGLYMDALGTAWAAGSFMLLELG